MLVNYFFDLFSVLFQLQNRGKGVCLDSAGSAYDKKMNIILRSCDIVNVQVGTLFTKGK